MASIRGEWWSFVAVLLILLVGAVGCGDSAQGGTTSNDGTSGVNQFIMVPDGGYAVEGEVTHDVDLRVYLYDRSTDEPVSERPVSFEVVGADDDPSAPSLASLTVYTEENGSATVNLVFGTEVGQWTVRASNPSSNDVEFEVTSVPTEAGDIEVALVNTAPSIMTLSDIDVRLYRTNQFDCGQYAPYGPQNDQTIAEDVAPFTEDYVTFENLSTRNRYVVTAVARGEQGQIAAGACLDNLTVQHESTTKAELLLQLVPLNPTGRYDVLSHWDFTEALAESGPAGSVIVRVLDIFENPGQAIYDEIINLIGNLVGGIISATFDTFLQWTGLDQTFQNFINDFIAGSEGLSQVWAAGQDLRDVVANLEVHSELSIGKLASDFEFRGRDNWLGITLYWTWGCEPADGPDCGAIELKADGDGEFAELGVLSSDWTGRVAAYNQLHIDQHTVSLRYGRLILYVLNDVLLPAVTDGNANSMSEAFSYWFGCDSIANSIIPDGEICAANYCLEASTVEDFCETAVSTVFGFADILINNLEFDMGLRLGGEGLLVEETSDGLVDRIDDGKFDGVIEDGEGSSTSSSFSATWVGERSTDDPF